MEARDLSPPWQLSQLPCLHRLLISRGIVDPTDSYVADSDGSDDEEEEEEGLPPGDWLGRLTHLAVSLPMLLASVDTLQHCAALRQLSILRILPVRGERQGWRADGLARRMSGGTFQ